MKLGRPAGHADLAETVDCGSLGAPPIQSTGPGALYTKMKLQNIGVIGAGTMGNGIAQTCAIRGYNVIMHDNLKRHDDQLIG